jgi:UDP-2,3-diacylglucosamine hydrolase
MRRIFLADVHLSPAHPARTARLREFLDREHGRLDELYILGDLFDYWIGRKHLAQPDYREPLAALRTAIDAGTRVVFVIGNRDFYMDRLFAETTGIELVPGRVVHRLVAGREGEQRVFLCHGDYLEGRRGLGFRIQELIRSRPVEWVIVRLPAPLALAGARFYRWISGRKSRRPKAGARHLGPYGLSERAVAAVFRNGADVIVCGHVHTPQQVMLTVDGGPVTLYTLGDWSDGESYLVEENGRWQFGGRPPAVISMPPEDRAGAGMGAEMGAGGGARPKK